MKMGYPPFLRSPKKEEQQVPDSAITETQFVDIKESSEEADVMNELFEGIWGIEDEDGLQRERSNQSQLTWDFMDWEQQEQEQEQDEGEGEEEEKVNVKKEEISVGFWEMGDEKRVSLNLNLNYQEVLDAWSDRGPLWADDFSHSTATCSGYYMGEVPVMEEDRSTRREASVLRYKEKRQSRLFSKKIRYQVRKLNADKRPRLKGRFVKRIS